MKQYVIVAIIAAAVVFGVAIPAAQAVSNVFGQISQTVGDASFKVHRAN